jgi:hypothetical protein
MGRGMSSLRQFTDVLDGETDLLQVEKRPDLADLDHHGRARAGERPHCPNNSLIVLKESDCAALKDIRMLDETELDSLDLLDADGEGNVLFAPERAVGTTRLSRHFQNVAEARAAAGIRPH